MSPIKKKAINVKTYLSYAIPTFFMAIATADFVDDGKLAKELVAALLMICLGSLGLKIDQFIEQVGGTSTQDSSDAAGEDDKIGSSEK